MCGSLKFRCTADVRKHLTDGYRAILRDLLHTANSVLNSLLYPLPRISALPVSAQIPPNVDRNREIYNRYLAGERAQKLADEFGISVQRVNWLVNRFRENAVWCFHGRLQFHKLFAFFNFTCFPIYRFLLC
jgi:hypothetical protein